jgi:hypothetical protein
MFCLLKAEVNYDEKMSADLKLLLQEILVTDPNARLPIQSIRTVRFSYLYIILLIDIFCSHSIFGRKDMYLSPQHL